MGSLPAPGHKIEGETTTVSLQTVLYVAVVLLILSTLASFVFKASRKIISAIVTVTIVAVVAAVFFGFDPLGIL